MAKAPLRLGAVEWGLIALQSMLWGSSYFFVAVVVQDQVPILTVVAIRGVFASIMLIAIVTSLGYRMPATLTEWGHFAFFSTFNTLIPFALIVWGQSRATGGMAAILNSSAPLFGIFLAHLLTHDEKLSANKLAGIVLGMVGVAILVGSDLAVMSTADLMARLALLAAPILYVLANIYARNRLGEYPPFVIAMMQMVASIFIAVPLALAVDQPWTLEPSMRSMLAVVALAVFSTGFAFTIYFHLLARIGSISTASQAYLRILFGVGFGVTVLGERLTPNVIAGLVLVFAGVVAMTLPPRRTTG